MSERVDKKWIDRGIDAYSTEAILGTLTHYGVPLTAEQYVELTRTRFPLAIAQEWHAQWKGTGQFSRFPAAAAEQLWSRLLPGQIAPTDLALGLINLLGALESALDGKSDDGTWDTRFKVVEAYLPKIPGPDERRQRFLVETLAAVGEDWSQVFDGMPQALVKQGHAPLADRICAVDEGLFPEHLGVTASLVQAARGELEPAVTRLLGIANDAARIPFARLGAVNALMDLKRAEGVTPALLQLLDVAETSRDVDVATEVVDTLQRVMKGDSTMKNVAAIRERIEKLIETFNA